MTEEHHGGEHHSGVSLEFHHEGHHGGGITKDPRFLAYAIIFAAIIMAAAMVYSAQASFTLASKISAMATVAIPTATVQVQVTATPTAAPTQAAATGGPSLAGAISRGSGSVVMVEYSDFQCPYCGRAEATVEQIIDQDYKGKVKLVYKHFPLGMHENAERASEAFECARDQGDEKAWALHHAMYSDQEKLSEADLIDKAKAIAGMDAAKFETCLKSGSKASVVEADLNEGTEVGVEGTPAFFLAKLDASGNPVGAWKSVSGAQPFANFKKVIDGLLG